ncbi:unnamed protein product [Cochlearia groenlandica]
MCKPSPFQNCCHFSIVFDYVNLWITRNHLIFENRKFSEEETLPKAIREAREWQLRKFVAVKPQLDHIRVIPVVAASLDIQIGFVDTAWQADSLLCKMG